MPSRALKFGLKRSHLYMGRRTMPGSLHFDDMTWARKPGPPLPEPVLVRRIIEGQERMVRFWPLVVKEEE